MRKVILSVLTFCSLTATAVHAEDTDISQLENVVYIEPVSISVGQQYTLSVKMKNAVEAEGFGFDLYLPDGINFVTDDDGLPLAELSTARTTPKKTNSFDAAFQGDGCLRVLAASTNGSVISGNDGEVCLVTIQVAQDVVEGSYPLILKNIAISDTEATSHRTELVESTIIVLPPSDSRVILDENSTTVPESATGVDIRVKRTIREKEWSTICLPFAMTETQMTEVFGSDVRLADFGGTEPEFDDDDNVVRVTASFTTVTELEANHPYLIWVSQPISEFILDGVDIDSDEDEAYVEFDNGKSGSRRVVYSGFYGTYHAGTVLDKFTLFLNGNKFWYSMGQTRMKAFRAYFDFLDVLTDVEEAEVKLFISSGDAPDGIESLVTDPFSAEEDGVYDLSGCKRSGKLQRGVYIVNRKKVAVK